MSVQILSGSLSQSAYCATQVLENESRVAQLENIAMYDLMEKAGSAIFSYIQKNIPGCKNIFVLCGKGNNGGDGFVVARLANAAGINVTVYLCAELVQLQGDAKTAFEALQANKVRVIDQKDCSLTDEFFVKNEYDIIVDALFGIGFKGQLPEALLSIVCTINQSDRVVVSVDIPSGLDASTGHVCNQAIVATHTITFIAIKQGLLTGQAAKYTGSLFFADLSLGTAFQKNVPSSVVIQTSNNIPKLLPRCKVSHKGDIGMLLTLGGNVGMPGAIRLASEAALKSGAALVAVCCHQLSQVLVMNGRPELMLTPDDLTQLVNSRFYQKAKVLLCGPGLGRDSWATAIFSQKLFADKTCVLDADALYLLAQNPNRKNNRVLTPHPGEAAFLLGCSIEEIEKDRFAAVNQLVEKYGGICVLKGAGTLIADKNNVWINTTGNPGMASGGMGDVLSGIIAALLMQMEVPIDAVRLAVYLHGKSADIVATKQGEIGMLASDLFEELSPLLNQGKT